MPTSQKKASTKRGGAVRDITVKKMKSTDDEGFQVHHIHDEDDVATVEPLITNHSLREETRSVEDQVEDAMASMGVDSRAQDIGDVEPRDFVKVKFAKFVQLVTSRDCSDVVAANLDEDVVMSSNLLAELASSHDEREEKKIPLVFLVGLAIGVVVTYILFMK